MLSEGVSHFDSLEFPLLAGDLVLQLVNKFGGSLNRDQVRGPLKFGPLFALPSRILPPRLEHSTQSGVILTFLQTLEPCVNVHPVASQFVPRGQNLLGQHDICVVSQKLSNFRFLPVLEGCPLPESAERFLHQGVQVLLFYVEAHAVAVAFQFESFQPERYQVLFLALLYNLLEFTANLLKNSLLSQDGDHFTELFENSLL